MRLPIRSWWPMGFAGGGLPHLSCMGLKGLQTVDGRCGVPCSYVVLGREKGGGGAESRSFEPLKKV